MKRAFLKSELGRTIDSAVAQSRASLSGGLQGGTAPPAIAGATEGVNDDGEVINMHDFFLGLDTLGDPATVLRASGRKINFVTF